ncbi:MAG TPA: type II toxin-antitoxin system prevent-host-death family antitoxin [Microbacteriaceae bacterium]|nr:type II toxin-antitoxin system prevent-host-death family antitoxin [Microbacteriaceae bacterium]
MNVQDAKTQLSRLLAAAERGEEVIIARGGKPIVRLELLGEPRKRELGFLAGLIPTPPDSAFFEPMTEEDLADWEGAYEGPV